VARAVIFHKPVPRLFPFHPLGEIIAELKAIPA
jgi:hypothetical protein